MKTTRFLLACAALLTLGVFAAAITTPKKLNFQGKLVDPATNNPKNGTFSMTFALYKAPTGGAAYYSETQPGVVVTNGVFSVQIGTLTALDESVFPDASTYLGVTVSPDAEMTPRTQLVQSPYAFTAGQLSQDSDILIAPGNASSTFTATGDLTMGGGVNASSASFTNGVTASSGTFTATGASQYSLAASSGIVINGGTLNVNGGGGVTNTYGLLTATLTVTGNSFTVGGSSFVVTQSSVGIGTSSPKTLLDVNGMATIRGQQTDVSTLTVLGNAFSVGGSSFTMNGGSATVAYSLTAGNFDWIFLSSGTLNAAATTLTVNIAGTGFTQMKFQISWPAALSAAVNPQIQFNADSTANHYSSQMSENRAAPTTNINATNITLANTAATTNPGYFVVEGTCVPTQAKFFTFSGVRTGLAVATAPLFYIGAGYWINVANPITSITLLLSGAGNYPAGTTIRVFGAM